MIHQTYQVDYTVGKDCGVVVYALTIHNTVAGVTVRLSGWDAGQDDVASCRESIVDLRHRRPAVFAIGVQVYSFDAKSGKLSISGASALDLADADDCHYVADALDSLACQLAAAT